MESSMKTKVMVVIDNCEFSEHALSWIFQNLGSTIVDTELLIYTARIPVDISYLYASSWATAELMKELKDSEKKAAIDLLKKAKTICSNHGIPAEGMTEVGDPKVVICNAVENLKHSVARGRQSWWGSCYEDIAGECQQLLCSPCQVPCSCHEHNRLNL
ncbi:uncharacterized protein LOC112522391 [Cynara cardunculus var. scolymus]|uniref:uncharacterized protein LOC112522391 n=1 Tax=Cynara cardunculus var. scolymus TaxID=59895 RepID=UPI000D62D2AD|nr:uncharacterized protein LOC112522391 [Cynara cardunculus var. scolymus]